MYILYEQSAALCEVILNFSSATGTFKRQIKYLSQWFLYILLNATRAF